MVVNPYQQPSQPLCPAHATFCQEIASAIACTNLPAKLANAAAFRLIFPASPASAATNAVTISPVQISPSLFTQLMSWHLKAVAQNSLDPPSDGLSTAAPPFASVDPAAPFISSSETLAASLPPGNLLSTLLTDVDWLLDTVYGDHVHANPSSHLSGDVAKDQEWWQTCLQWLIVYLSQHYDLPKGLASKHFLADLPLCWTWYSLASEIQSILWCINWCVTGDPTAVTCCLILL